MNSKIKKLGNSQVEVEVKIAESDFAEFWNPEYEEALKRVHVKGFRPGTAPKNLLDQGVDKEKVFHLALNRAVRKTLDEVISENDWTVIDQPQVEVLDAKSDIAYKAVLTLFPEIKLGDYLGLAKKAYDSKKNFSVEEKEVKESLKWLQNSRAAIARVDREAKGGDVAECDIKTFLGDKEIENARFESHQFVLGESSFVPGFDEKIIGQKEGAELKFSLVAPEKYWNKEVQGKKLDFEVKVKGVYQRTLPQLNDEFAASLGEKFKTIGDLEASIKEGILKEKEEKEAEKSRAKLLKDIVEVSKVEVPQVMTERILKGMVEEAKTFMPQSKDADLAKLEADLKEKLKDRAKENAASHLVLYAIAQKENLQPTAEEVEKEAASHGVDPENYYDYIYERLQNQKVFRFLEEKAKAN